MSIDDPATSDIPLSQQTGDAAVCPGPVVFPMAEGAEADAWAREFGYPLESQTGGLSLETLLAEVQARDAPGRFMIQVYDELVTRHGGEGSDEAAAFLTNFMPLNGAAGDERQIWCRLTYLDSHNITAGAGGMLPSDSGEIGGESVPRDLAVIGAGAALMHGEYEIIVARQRRATGVMGFGVIVENVQSYTAAEAADKVIEDVQRAHTTNAVIGWLVLGANVLLIFVGVGAAIGAIRVAATVGGRLAATVVLAFEVSEGTEYLTGYIGGRGHGYNPLKQAFRWAGQSANGAGGADMAEYVYNTLNITVGFGGKIGLLAGGLYATTQMPGACLPVEGDLEERALPSQDGAHRTVF